MFSATRPGASKECGPTWPKSASRAPRRFSEPIKQAQWPIFANSSCSCCLDCAAKQCNRIRLKLIGEISPSLSMRTKVRIVYETRPLGHMWTSFQVTITIVACAYFAAEGFSLEHRSLWAEELAFGVLVLTDVLIRFYCADYRKTFLFQRPTIVDLLTIIPMCVDLVVLMRRSMHMDSQSPLLVRFLHLLKLLRILRIWDVGRQFSPPSVRQGMALILGVIIIIYISASLVTLTEEEITFPVSIYFVIVTMATVGYGDVTCKTDLGRFVTCLLICVSFIWVPYELNKLTSTLSLRSRYMTLYEPEADKPNVLLVGHLDAGKLSTFLAEFFHPDRRTRNDLTPFHHVVVLDRDEPKDDVVDVMEDPLIESRVTFVRGTLMDESDLLRAGAGSAVACFVFNDGLTADTEAADAITVLRALVLKTFRPNLPCYVQLHHAHNRLQLHMLKKQRLICIEDIKLSIMGLSSLYPGFTTLLMNLLKSVAPVQETGLLPWQTEYLRGSSMEVYVIQLPQSFSGLRFDRVARDLYTQFDGKLSLLGIEERQVLPKELAAGPSFHVKRVLINPGRKFVMRMQAGANEVWGYILARSRRLAEQVQHLEVNQHWAVQVHQETAYYEQEQADALAQSSNSSSSSNNVMSCQSSRRDSNVSLATRNRTDDERDRPAADRRASDDAQKGIDNRSTPQFAGYLQSLQSSDESPLDENGRPLHPADPSSPASTMQSPVAEPDTTDPTGADDDESAMEETTFLPRLGSLEIGITSIEDVRTLKLEGHIIVILPKAAEKLQCLLRPLRSQFLQGTDYHRAVVILSDIGLTQLQQRCVELEPSGAGERSISFRRDPAACDVYVVEGQTHKLSDLRRAGIETAYSCLILANQASVQEIDEEAVDESVIHQFVGIEKLRSRIDPSVRRPLNYVVEVLSMATLKILDQTYKTFRGKAKQHKARRAPSQWGGLRDRFSVFTANSPIRASMVAGSRTPFKAGSPLPQHQLTMSEHGPFAQSPMPGQGLDPASVQRPADLHTSLPDNIPAALSPRAQSAASSLDFGIGHCTMYPFVTAGTSFLIDIFDIISCQLFYNTELIRFIDLLLNLDHSTISMHAIGSGNGAFNVPGHTADSRAYSGRLCRIPVPMELVGKDYGTLFELLMSENETMPIALYRHDIKADVCYVYTGPAPTTVLQASDAIFCLAPIHKIHEVLKKHPSKGS